MELKFLDQTLVLLPEKALFWKENNLLVIADFHLGKTSLFRMKGFALPGGSTTNDLIRLSALTKVTGADTILFLGDLFHTKSSVTSQTLDAASRWREENSHLSITFIRGNHDRRADELARKLNIEIRGDSCEIFPFLFSHKPEEHPDKFVIAGHLHPAVRLAGPGKQREKLPCFYFTKHYAVLPSFGIFTGTYVIEPKPADRVFVVAEDEVIEVKFKM